MATNQRTITFRCNETPNQLRFCPDGSYVAIGFPHGDVLVVFLDPENSGKELEFFRYVSPLDSKEFIAFGPKTTSTEWISNEKLLINHETCVIVRRPNSFVINTYDFHNTWGLKPGLYISKDPFRCLEPHGRYITAEKELRATNTICKVEGEEGDIKIAFFENDRRSTGTELNNGTSVQGSEGSIHDMYQPQDLEVEL